MSQISLSSIPPWTPLVLASHASMTPPLVTSCRCCLVSWSGGAGRNPILVTPRVKVKPPKLKVSGPSLGGLNWCGGLGGCGWVTLFWGGSGAAGLFCCGTLIRNWGTTRGIHCGLHGAAAGPWGGLSARMGLTYPKGCWGSLTQVCRPCMLYIEGLGYK